MPKLTLAAFWTICLSLSCGAITFLNAEAPSSPRDYNYPATPLEAADIKYVVTTMGNANNPLTYVALLGKRGELTRRGENIDQVHPLRFLSCIFSDEQMKASMRNIHKNMTWRNFLYGESGNGGLCNSLNEEASRNNLLDEQIYHFSTELGINFDKYHNLIQNRQWEPLVVALIEDIPRKGNYRQYDY